MLIDLECYRPYPHGYQTTFRKAHITCRDTILVIGATVALGLGTWEPEPQTHTISQNHEPPAKSSSTPLLSDKRESVHAFPIPSQLAAPKIAHLVVCGAYKAGVRRLAWIACRWVGLVQGRWWTSSEGFGLPLPCLAGGGLPKQRGVAGRVHEDGMVVVHGSPAWWGRRTMPNIICSAVDLAETRKPPRKRLNGLTA